MGYRSVGKSSLTIQFVEGQFVDSYDPTIENTFTKTVKVRGQDYYLKLVDTAGQDEFSLFPLQYTMDIHGYCLVYSINSLKSFEVVKVIHEKLIDLTGQEGNIPILLVGNKTDLQLERVVPTEDGKRLAAKMKAHFVEVCAKQNSAVTDLFNNLLINIERTLDDGNSEKPPNKCILS